MTLKYTARPTLIALVTALLVALMTLTSAQARADTADYSALLSLFEDWREFEQVPLRNGAPDYTAKTQAERRRMLPEYEARLQAIDPSGWSVEQQVDWHLVRAEMNGLRYDLHVLQPWVRDPAYYASVRTYQSDTPAEEGPTIQYAVRLWEYSIWPRTTDDEITPLTSEAEAELAAELRTIAPLLSQAKDNLVSNTRDLWMAATRSFSNQRSALEDLAERVSDTGDDLRAAVREAQAATDDFLAWLEDEAPKRTGPSGIGKQNYTWFLRHVLYLPLSWEKEVTITEREIARSHASLRLEEQRNRDLPQLEPAANPEEFDRMQDEAIDRYIAFLQDKRVMPVEDWYARALRERWPTFSPPETRNFFATARSLEPNTLWTHMYHWWDLEKMRVDPHESPIRRGALRYNIWMSRSEGMATVNEEWMMHAGLYDDNPRAREVVWIMLAMRAARANASLWVHAHETDMAGAGELHVKWTPRGWMRPDLDLLGREQHMYLRQPGYGPSYVTAGRLLDDLMAERARQLGDDDFSMYEFFAELNEAGMIPVSLLRWQMTGRDDEIRELMSEADDARPGDPDWPSPPM